MYVDTSYKRQKEKVHRRDLIRESFREDGKVKHRTIANISKCSDQEIEKYAKIELWEEDE